MSQFAILHVAKREFNLDDDGFRDVLERVTGKRSLRAMTQKERENVLLDFKRRGFQVKSTKRQSSKAYVRKVFALWTSCGKLGVIDDKSRKALRSFVANETRKRGKEVSDPNFLTYEQASPVIETLKKMENRGKENAKKT